MIIVIHGDFNLSALFSFKSSIFFGEFSYNGIATSPTISAPRSGTPDNRGILQAWKISIVYQLGPSAPSLLIWLILDVPGGILLVNWVTFRRTVWEAIMSNRKTALSKDQRFKITFFPFREKKELKWICISICFYLSILLTLDNAHTHTRRSFDIYIYIYMCVCVCVYVHVIESTLCKVPCCLSGQLKLYPFSVLVVCLGFMAYQPL